MRGVGKMNVALHDAFPPFLAHCVPSRPHLTAMFVCQGLLGEQVAHHVWAAYHCHQTQSHSRPPAHGCQAYTWWWRSGQWWADVYHMWWLWCNLWSVCSAQHSTLPGKECHRWSSRLTSVSRSGGALVFVHILWMLQQQGKPSSIHLERHRHKHCSLMAVILFYQAWCYTLCGKWIFKKSLCNMRAIDSSWWRLGKLLNFNDRPHMLRGSTSSAEWLASQRVLLNKCFWR